MRKTTMRMHLPRLLNLGWLIAIPLILNAEEAGDWHQVKEKDGITVYQREVPGWSIKEVRAAGQVQAPLQTVKRIVEDISQANRINSVVSQSGDIRADNTEQSAYFIVLDMPWPSSDRSAIYRRQVSSTDNGNVFTFFDQADSAINTVAAMKKTVRIIRSTQQWTLRKVNDNTTEVTLTSLTDPNGPIPAFLINTLSVDAPLESIQNIRLLCKGTLQ